MQKRKRMAKRPAGSIFSQNQILNFVLQNTRFQLGLWKFCFYNVFAPTCPTCWELAPSLSTYFGGGAFRKAGQVSCKAPSTTSRPDVSHSISFPAFVLTNNRIGHQVSIRSTRKAGHWLSRLHCRSHIVLAWLPVAAGMLHSLSPTKQSFDQIECITTIILDLPCHCSLCWLKACRWMASVKSNMSEL